MLVFVIPVRSAQVADDWSRVQRLVRRTVASALGQRDAPCHCILACHERPFEQGEFGDRTEFVEMNYAPPKREELTSGDHGDKWIKLHHGLVAARDRKPTHLMLLDEDDLVSNRIGATVAASPEVEGWNFQKGYIHHAGRNFLLRKNHFAEACGSSFVLRVDEGSLPSSRADDREDFPILRWGHGLIAEKMTAAGQNIRDLPFPGAIYMVGSGENCTDHGLWSFTSRLGLLKRPWKIRPITSGLQREFSLST